MSCGHPLSARQVVFDTEARALRTVCWACRVEREIAARARRKAA